MSGANQILGMSDDDFLKGAPPSVEPTPVVVEEPKVEPEAQPVVVPEAVVTPEPEAKVEPPVEEEEEVVDDSKPPKVVAEEDPAKNKEEPFLPVGSETKDPKATVEPEKKAGEEEVVTPPNYEEFYTQIMTPFKANGKMITLKTPDEAIKLMQMGANYTKRIQDMAPHRKVLAMLQNNDLLDEGKLSYLIDLDKKNPDAIKKLVKDSGIDPLDINTTEESGYKPSNHSVTDEEVNLVSVLEDVGSTQEGKQTLQIINTTWDQASKEALWKSPEIIGVIQSQRDNGVYDQIVAEMDRQKVLGVIPTTTPFLQAYKQVGDDMMARKAFVAPKTEVQQPTVVATRTATPKPVIANGDKARAASPTKTSPNKAAEFINPLAMSDDDFIKQMNNRL